ncbi:putative glycosyltransferase, group 1 [Candidatus Vecturithrix granuli]|uniref:Putative glycosyltransferase, group 1 n=1 Tax=Vecturithrix granuli TaxID=1499967 RepID=A0A081BYM6_VECG1|nr:putative glycosyltransferase, group 1 [Candidatus Vecturithrix granuli]
MIKVCHIITQLELGGAQQNTLFTVEHLDRSQFLPILITGAEGLLIEEANQCADVQKYYLPELIREIRPAQDLRVIIEIRRILRQEFQKDPQTPLIVHTHSSKAGIVGRWAAKLAGVRWILHSIHGFGFHPYQSFPERWAYIFLEWLTARITTHFIAVSAANIATGIHYRLFSRDRVSLIRSGIDIARFQQYANRTSSEGQMHRTQMLRNFHLPQDKSLIGMVACFKPQKAPLDFIRVMKMVVERYPQAHAVMVGDGVLRSQIEAMIAEYHLEETISLVGWRTDIAELLPLFDVLVLTSYWEGLPRVCPQAMAAGLPIVATNVDGIPEAVQDGITGFLAQPGDLRALADKIVYVLEHPEIAQEMGRKGQERVAEFDIYRMVHQQEELYRSLIARH